MIFWRLFIGSLFESFRLLDSIPMLWFSPLDPYSVSPSPVPISWVSPLIFYHVYLFSCTFVDLCCEFPLKIPVLCTYVVYL